MIKPHMIKPLRLGTRASPLALAQAQLAAAALCAAHGWGEDAILIVPMTATGDRIVDRPLVDVGGKALWTRELDRALAEDVIDIAVHSMKDVETIRPEIFVLAAMLPRADVRDRLVGAATLDAIPPGGRIGTASPRRAAQVRRARPDLTPVLFRGNVATRLAKLERGEADATLLAAAGLDRLGAQDIGHAVPVETMLPAPAQGAVGIERLAARADLAELIAAIDHRATSAAVLAERALLAALHAGCRSPVAALARAEGAMLRLDAEILAEDGSETVAGSILLDPGDPAAAGTLAHELLGRASPALRALFGG
jgi:hydroxymethylbilane synthase